MRKGNKLINEGRVPKRRTVSQQIITDVANGYYLDGIEAGYKAGHEDGQQEAYQRGLDDAWEVARKICVEYTDDKLMDMGFAPAEREFCDAGEWDMYEYSCNVIGVYTASEAIEKIKEWEVKQKKDVLDTNVGEIRVGDEVTYDTSDIILGVVVGIYNTGTKKPWAKVLQPNGYQSESYLENLKCTGRKFPQVADILEQMKGES